MRVIDDKNKNLNLFTRNYFYFTTILVVAINVLLYAIFANDFTSAIQPTGFWYDQLNFTNLARVFLNGVEHANWQHVLLNM